MMTSSNSDVSMHLNSSHSNNAESEWSVVTSRKGFRKRYQKQQKPTATTIPYQTVSSSSSSSRRRRQQERQHPTVSPEPLFMKNHLCSLQDELKSSEWWSGTKALILDAMGGQVPSTVILQCLGIGSFQQSKWPLHQLACALLIQDLTNAQSCSVSDPVMTDADNKLVEQIGWDVAQARPINEVTIEGDDSTDSWLVLFMPHCGRELIFAVLNRWLDRKQMDHIVYVGNSLCNYKSQIKNKLYPVGQEDFERVRVAIDSHFFKQWLCPDCKLAPVEFAFNDLAVVNFTCKSESEIKL